MATPPQQAKGVRWLYIAVALIVVLGLAFWLTTHNAGSTTDGATAPSESSAPVGTTAN